MNTKKYPGNWRPVGPFPSIAAAARITGMHRSTLAGRLRRDWNDFDALSIPVGVNPYHNVKKWGFYREAWLKKQLRAKNLRVIGMSYREIAAVLDCSTGKVSDLLKRKTPAYS